MLQSKDDIICSLGQSPYHRKALETVAKLNIPNCWIAAGFVRNHVWDQMYNDKRMTRLNDVDVIYFDPDDKNKATEKKLELSLQSQALEYPWSVKNQARMYEKNNDKPYKTIEDALLHWCETVTPICARINTQKNIEILAPLGIDDLLNGSCHATPHAKATPSKLQDYKDRMNEKKWWLVWDDVKVYDLEDDS